VERVKENRSEVVILNTKQFTKPVAIVQLPFHVKAQIHGNWVDGKSLAMLDLFVRDPPPVQLSGKSAMNFLP